MGLSLLLPSFRAILECGKRESVWPMRVSLSALTGRHVVWFLTILLVVIWVGYLLAGQQLITVLYNSRDFPLADRFISDRASTPVEVYYRRADAVLVHSTLWFMVASAIVWLLLRNPGGLLLFSFSSFLTSFFFFCLFESFPSLISVTHLDNVLGYYAYKTNYVRDPELVFREKPFNRRVIHDFTGAQYSPRYGIEVNSYSIEWVMDKDGFRNPGAAASVDIVVVGDSYMEYGSTETDTFVGRLQKQLPRLSVRNLGKSGYSAGQYVEVLKRFGLQYKPKLALMAFYEGNDVSGVRDYLLWKSGRTSELHGYLYKFATNSLWRRYVVATTATLTELRKKIRAIEEVPLAKLATIRGYAPKTHPDIAVLNLRGHLYPKLFIDKLPEITIAQMLATEEFEAMRNLFSEFREICESNSITPLVLYIPTASQIYAPYTTPASGSHWLQMRDRQVAVRRNTEKAITLVARQSGLDLISLTPVFERAATEGKMVYYALDSHWNAEGREIAAQFVADVVKKRFQVPALESSERPISMPTAG